MSKRNTYTDEFKTMIAELVLSGKPVKEVADKYSLSQSTIRGWVNKKAPIEVERVQKHQHQEDSEAYEKIRH